MNTEHKSNTPSEIKDLWKTPKFVFDYYDSRFNYQKVIEKAEEIINY